MISATNISLYTMTAASLAKKGTDASAQDIAAGAINILDTVTNDTASTQAAKYIKGKTQNPDKQEQVLETIKTALEAKTGRDAYEPDSITAVITDIRTKLGLSATPKPARVVSAAPVKGEISAEVGKVTRTGGFGGDGSPEVKIAVKIEGLPAGAHTLSGMLRTNQDWPAGVAMVNGKTSGTFYFQAYLHPGNQKSPFYIMIADKNGKDIGRIPEGADETLKVSFPR